MAKVRLIQAINQALFEEMERDPSVVVIGEDVEASIFGDTRGLYDHFGPDRVRNTPISEATLTGMAVGAAASGTRIVLHMMFGNFLYTGFDGIANQMAKLRMMTGGQITLPITLIANYGGGRSTAAQHSDVPFAALMNLAGLEIAVPSGAADAKGLLKTAIRSNNPTIFLEPGGRGGDMAEVPDGDVCVPFGQAATLAQGSDLTLITMGSMTRLTLQAAKRLETIGVSTQVVDLRTLCPLDEATILSASAATGRIIIIDESRDTCSAASHIAALIVEKSFDTLRAPIRRITVPDTAMPYAPSLEKPLMPSVDRIIAAASELLARPLENLETSL